MLSRPMSLLSGMCVLTLLAGCAGESAGSVTGTVKVDGQPTGGFFVHFEPEDKTDGDPLGSAGKDGTYQIYMARGNDQIPAGKYRVYLEPTDQIEGVPRPKVKLGPEFTKADSATIVKEVVGGKNVIDIEVTSSK